jgi:hypothetical protein
MALGDVWFEVADVAAVRRKVERMRARVARVEASEEHREAVAHLARVRAECGDRIGVLSHLATGSMWRNAEEIVEKQRWRRARLAKAEQRLAYMAEHQR